MLVKTLSNNTMNKSKRCISTLFVVYLTCILAVGSVIPAVLSQPADSWWNSSWTYRKLLTINASQVSGVLVDYPILVQTSDIDIAAHAQSSGNDIAFILYNDNSTKLSHEMEYYNSATGTIYAWVNIPRLSATSNTKIWMYYGNPAASAQQNIIGTWNSNFIMVQHLNETNAFLSDSTGYHNNGISTGTNATNMGKIDGARLFNGNDRIVVNNFTHSPTALTVEAWVYRDNTSYIYIADKGIYSQTDTDWILYLRNDQPANQGIDFSIRNHSSFIRAGDPPVGTWFYVAATFGSGAASLYLNDTLLGSASSWPAISNRYPHLGLGNDYQGNEGTAYPMNDVRLDEIRISNTARNSSWVSTCYHNQMNPAGFVNFGSEEQYPSAENQPPFFGTPAPVNGSTNQPLSLTWSIPISDPDGDPFTWSIECNNGDSNSGSSASNGTKTATLVNLAYATTYKVWVNATDPAGSNTYTKKWYRFTTGQAPAISVVITKPLQNTFYFNDEDTHIAFSGNTIVYGKITITINVTSATEVSKVVFLVDGTPLTDPDPSTPYTCEWQPIIQFNANLSLRHTLKVIVSDAANNTASAEVNITKWRFHPLPWILVGVSYASRLLPHTTVVGVFYNVQQTRNRITSFYALRATYKTLAPLERTRGVLNFKQCTGGFLIGPMTLTHIGLSHKIAIGSFTVLGHINSERGGLGSFLRILRS